MQPEYIYDSKQIEKLLLGKEPESKVLEYKKGFNPSNPIETARDIAQFANTDGGVLLFGIEEDRAAYPSRPKGYHDIEMQSDLVAQLTQIICNWLSPDTIRCEMIPLKIKSYNLLAINIYPSSSIVVVWKKNQDKNAPIPLEFPYRTNLGKRSMSVVEMELHIMDTTRARRHKIEHLKAKITGNNTTVEIDSVPVVLYLNHHDGNNRPEKKILKEGIEIRKMFENELEIHFSGPKHPEQTFYLPYEWIRSSWISFEEKISLDLSATFRNESGAYKIMPAV